MVDNDTFHRDSSGITDQSEAYGIKTFDLGGHGWVEPVTTVDTNGLNLTAYAVGNGSNVYDNRYKNMARTLATPL